MQVKELIKRNKTKQNTHTQTQKNIFKRYFCQQCYTDEQIRHKNIKLCFKIGIYIYICM
jgi:hypothetical protein